MGWVIFIGIILIAIVWGSIEYHNDQVRELNRFNNNAVILVTYDEFVRYYMVCPAKWGLFGNEAKYYAGNYTDYKIGFKTFKDYQMYQDNLDKLHLSEKREKLLKYIKQDIETYLEKTHQDVQQEIEKIKLTMQKDADGKQDIDATILSFGNDYTFKKVD